MQTRPPITHSSGSVTRAKMYASICFVILIVGCVVGDYAPREAPYNVGPNDPYASINPALLQEPSQRLFWGTQGSNQVGGTGLWASLTNKFPFLGQMFGRIEQLPTQYGVPQYDVPQNSVPNQYAQSGLANQLSTQYGVPQRFQPQYYQAPQFYQQVPQQIPQQFGQRPSARFPQFGRDVGFTDDAVIVTPPFVPPVEPQPAPVPVPLPVPAPVPVPVAPTGYSYDKPQYRLELPQK